MGLWYEKLLDYH